MRQKPIVSLTDMLLEGGRGQAGRISSGLGKGAIIGSYISCRPESSVSFCGGVSISNRCHLLICLKSQ
jgi:hypothetical protein